MDRPAAVISILASPVLASPVLAHRSRLLTALLFSLALLTVELPALAQTAGAVGFSTSDAVEAQQDPPVAGTGAGKPTDAPAATPKVASDPKAVEVIQHAIEKLGGRDKLDRARNARVVLRQSLPGGVVGTILFTITTRRDGARQVIKQIGEKHQVLGHFKKTYWMTMFPDEVVSMPVATRTAFAREADLDTLLLDYGSKRYRAQSIPTPNGEGARIAFEPQPRSNSGEADSHPHQRIEVTFGAKNGLPESIEVRVPHPRRRGESLHVTTVLSEYRIVDGVRVPHKRETVLNGVVTMVTTVVECSFGMELADTLFERPL